MRVLALALASLCGLAPPLHAHEVPSAAFEAVLDRGTPLPARLEVRLVDTLAPQMLVTNRTGRVLDVLDRRGEPVIRIGPDATWVNAASPAYYAEHPVHDSPDAAAQPPRWVLASRDRSWGWFDPRIQPEAAVADGGWHIDMRLGGQLLTVSGRFRPHAEPRGYWRPALLTHAEIAPKVEAAIVPGPVPALTIDNGGDEPVTIIGSHGEKFLRIGPDGVFANALSPTWLQSGRAPETASPSVPARGRQAVRWTKISTGSRYTWLEWRARGPDDRAGRMAMPWRIPLLIGDKPVPLRGESDWIEMAAPRPALAKAETRAP